jgi:RNA polymerase sigma-70 factor (family 1)
LLILYFLNQPSIYNEPELLQQLKAGSESAFTQLFHYYRGTVYTTAIKFLHSPALAEEIVQDVFLKIWLKRAEIGEVKHLQGYLFIMARNIIFDRIKKLSYESTVSGILADEQISAGETDYLIRHHQCQQFLKQAIEQLPPQQQKIYSFVKEDGLSHERIADIMKISKHTVKKHMALALQSIRKYLDNHLHNFLWLMVLLNVMAS